LLVCKQQINYNSAIKNHSNICFGYIRSAFGCKHDFLTKQNIKILSNYESQRPEVHESHTAQGNTGKSQTQSGNNPDLRMKTEPQPYM